MNEYIVNYTGGGKSNIKLYSNPRSSCSWRIRLVLECKEIKYKKIDVDGVMLRSEKYALMNPMKKLPTLEVNKLYMTQSIAIMEYLNDNYNKKINLEPLNLKDKQRTKEIVLIIVSDIQPLQNLSILRSISEYTNFPEKDGEKNMHKWAVIQITRGLGAIEKIINENSKYCVGNKITFADCCLVPQFYNAVIHFGINKDLFPKIYNIYKNLQKKKFFTKAKPDNYVNI